MFCCYIAVESLRVVVEQPKFKKGCNCWSVWNTAMFSHIISCHVEQRACINV